MKKIKQERRLTAIIPACRSKASVLAGRLTDIVGYTTNRAQIKQIGEWRELDM